MKVYILVRDTWPYREISGVFKQLKDAEDQLESLGAYAEQYHIEEHELVE